MAAIAGVCGPTWSVAAVYRLPRSGEFRALLADLLDKAVKTTAYPITDYRTTPGLGARLMAASGTALRDMTVPGAEAQDGD